MKKSYLLLVSALALFITGCGPTKIVVPSYAAPAEYKKIQGISSGGDAGEGKYLALAINPDVTTESKNTKKQLSKVLISNVKQALTETNFITIYPIYDLANVALNMDVDNFTYNRKGTKLDAEMDVTFTITKGTTEFFVKKYSNTTRRQSASGRLPSQNKIMAYLGKKVVNKFISDISPLKTYQVREFKSLPGELEYVLAYAKQKNYESAIEGMEKVAQADRNLNFLYDLAILYEALASEKEDLKVLSKAKKYYEEAFIKGGSTDDLVIGSKARFDKFYRLLKMTEDQSAKNQTLKNELDDTYGQTE